MDPSPSYPCPRCGQDRGAEARLLCPDCWKEAPAAVRKRWVKALRRFQAQSPAAQALLAWARPAAAPAAAEGPAGG